MPPQPDQTPFTPTSVDPSALASPRAGQKAIMALVVLAALATVSAFAWLVFFVGSKGSVPAISTTKPTTRNTSTTGVILIPKDNGIAAITPDSLDVGSASVCALVHDTNHILSFPSWSFDGKKIVYYTQGPNGGSIGVANADGSDAKTLPIATVGALPSFSPDGTKIVYGDLTGGFESGAEVWLMNANGSGNKKLTITTQSSMTRDGKQITWSKFPSFSPDGTKIVYSSTQSGNSEIWVMNADGSNKKQLTFPTLAASPDANAPAWSPDGRNIVFWSGYETEYGNVWVMNADGSGRTQLTFEQDNVNSDDPNWSPDGTGIIYDSSRPLDYSNWDQNAPRPAHTWIMNADGGNQRLLTETYTGFQVPRHPWRLGPFTCPN